MKGARQTHPMGPVAAQDARVRPWRPSPGWLVLALVAALAAPAWWLVEAVGVAPPQGRTAPAETPAQTPAMSAMAQHAMPAAPPAVAEPSTLAAPGPSPAQASATAAPVPSVVPRAAPERDADPTPDLAAYVNRGEQPTMAEVISRLNAAGVHSGLGAFSPPGTKPALVGLAVPEDFALPPGYVRHHQATDDGQRIEPILMFAPEARFVDATGRQLALPADRVVPPELAPPGLPIRRIVIPASVEPRR